jgi:DnaJ homolog subfamily A member 5
VQTAYEILSNPHERAWYDAHRDEILHGAVPGSGEDHYEANVRVTTAEHITQMYMGFDGGLQFDDSLDGFFTTLRKFFERLTLEETLASEQQGEDPPSYPSFGTAEAPYETEVRPFYGAWSGFATRKTFAWKNIYRLSEAPDRRTRRLMDKENRKAREQGIRDFNSAVRALISFVRRRDPRVARATTAAPGEDLHAALRKKAARQAAKARQANQAAAGEYVAPSWAQREEANTHEGVIEDDEEPEANEILECIVCKKIFKSEQQYAAHEQSKKHRKAVHDMERRMRKESRALGLDVDTGTSGITTPAEDEGEASEADEPLEVELDHESDNPKEETIDDSIPSEAPDSKPSDAQDSKPHVDTSDAPNDAHEPSKPAISQTSLSSPSLSASEETDPTTDLASRLDLHALSSSDDDKASSNGAASRPGKAKQRRAKKEARAQAGGKAVAGDHRCNVCAATFTSKTKLFGHIRDTGHAWAVPTAVPETGGHGKKKKKG